MMEAVKEELTDSVKHISFKMMLMLIIIMLPMKSTTVKGLGTQKGCHMCAERNAGNYPGSDGSYSYIVEGPEIESFIPAPTEQGASCPEIRQNVSIQWITC